MNMQADLNVCRIHIENSFLYKGLVFCRYGEIVNINLVRDQKTGKSKGYCFICYEDQRSTILSVDNLNGIKVNSSYTWQSYFIAK